MNKKINFFLIGLFLMSNFIVFSQNKTITGTVTDQNSFPQVGVTVLIKGTSNGTQTDFDGKYSINANTGDVLVFSSVGFKTSEITVRETSIINVILDEDVEALEEVFITVPYGTVKKEAFVGSAAVVTAVKLEDRALTNVIQGLEGASPGVQFTPGSGQPGEAPNIRVRGIGSVTTSNAPLFILDGAIFTGNLASLSTNDIESITVLKDAASTSLYGSGASNGVIMITTKKGKFGKPRVTFEASQGFSNRSLREYSRVNAKEFYPLQWEAYRNSLHYSGDVALEDANQIATDDIFGLLGGYNPFNVPDDQIVGLDGSLNPNAQVRWDDLDWQDEVFNTGYRSNIDLSYSGATESTDYFASIGYLNETGYILKSDFERINARVNINVKPKDWFKTGINLSASSSNSNFAVDGASSSNSFVNPFRTTRLMGPIYPVFLHDPVTGEFVFDDAGNRIFDEGINRPESTGRHVIQENLLNLDLNKNLNINARSYIDFFLTKNLTFTTSLSMDKRAFDNFTYTNNIIGDAAPAGRASRTATNTFGLTFNQIFNYTNNFNGHNVSLLAGHENFTFDFNSLFARRTNQVVAGNTELINFAEIGDVNGFSREFRRESYFARSNYDYNSKYFLSASIRRDGSSRFERSVRWGAFWSLGGAWRLTEEKFLTDVSWLDELKLRSSYGQVGNDSNLDNGSLSFFVFQSLYGLGNNNGTEPGILISAPGNPDITWESNDQFDVALEFSLFNRRLSGTFEYYNRETRGLIFDVPLPVSSGLDNIPRNIGDMFNRGVEISLNADIVKNNNFTWNLDVNASTIKNEITRLPQEEIITGTKKLAVGTSIFEFWLRKWGGVDPSDGSALYIPTQEAIDNDSFIREIDGVLFTTNQNNAEFGFAGTSLPDLFGGITNTFQYKGFRFTTLFTYQIGGKTYDTNYAALMSAGNLGRAKSTDIKNRWQNPGDITNVPRLDIQRTGEFDAASDRWLVGSDFLALRQASLSYSFTDNILPKGLNSFRVFLNAENLFAITERRGLEPVQNFNGTTQNRSVPARILSFGFNAAF